MHRTTDHFLTTKISKVIYAGYCRTSSQGQRDDRTIETQVSLIEKFGKERGFQQGQMFLDDGVSGNTTFEERPGLRALLDYLKNNPQVEYIIITRYDRLGRNLIKTEAIIQLFQNLGVKLLVIENPYLMNNANSMVLLRHVMGSIGEYEKTLICERLKEGRNRKSSSGLFSGGRVPYGFSISREEKNQNKSDLVINENESKNIKLIFEMKKKK